MGTRLAESEAACFYVTDPKLFIDQMIQWDAARDDVAAAGAQTEINLELFSQCFDCFRSSNILTNPFLNSLSRWERAGVRVYATKRTRGLFVSSA